jgi:hypothetical protein
MNIVALLKEAYAIVKKREAEQLDIDERRVIANAFNDRYTYRIAYPGIKPKTHAWMCPDCNSIYGSIGFNIWTGLEYPTCCKTIDNHRCNYGIRVK